MNLVPREYQQNIFNSILRNGNTLVVLPTGLGKTLIALMLIEEKMKIGRCLFLSPTKPLCQQHFNSIKSTMGVTEDIVTIVTGDLPPSKRKEEYSKKIIVATPQTIRNDLENKITTSDFSLVIFDEGHRAVGNYAYTQIAQQTSQTALHVALTASPGGKKERINEVMAQLSLKNVEMRSSKDEDVKPYTHEVTINWKFVDLPPSYKLIKSDLDQLIKKHARTLAAMGFPPPLQSKTQFMQLRARILTTNSKLKFPALIQYSILLNLLHMVELLETQSMQIFADYLNGLSEKETKSAKILLKDPHIQDISRKCEVVEDHPKLKLLLDALSKEKGKKAIIFAHYRAQVKSLSSKLNSLGYSAKPFMGKKDGFNRKQQEETIESFRKGEFDYLVASSVHPNEYILVRNDETKEIFIKKIGEFVDQFIPSPTNRTTSKPIINFSTLSFDGKKTDFFPITQVHKHKRQNNVLKVMTRSGFTTHVTENHSLISFDKQGLLTAEPPKQNLFVKIAQSAPDPNYTRRIDIVGELIKNTSNSVLSKIYCIVNGLTQAKMRIYASDLKVLSILEYSPRSVKELSKNSKVDESTVIDVYRRVSGGVSVIKKGRYTILSLTKHGQEYLSFLKWFFKSCYYYKKRYRINIKNIPKTPNTISKFCDISVTVDYGKHKLPRFIKLSSPLAEFLGYYVSEGHNRKTKQTSEVFLAAMDKKMQKRMEKSIKDGLGITPSVTKKGVNVPSQIVHLLLKYVLKCGIGAYNKEVPNQIFSSPTNVKWKFLEGYARGDGCLSKKRIILTTVSKKLVVGLIFLLRQLGIKKISLVKSRKRSAYDIYIYESLPFHKIEYVGSKKSYFSTVPTALLSEKAFDRFKNVFVKTTAPIKSRVGKKPTEKTCFDYLKHQENLAEQPEYVYDLSVEKTENFFGGLGLLCLHNSIGEEGLDIPAVDMVIFYEPIPSEIRSIQRRGRTGRFAKGQVYILITKNTRDEYFYWASLNRERKMKNILSSFVPASTLPREPLINKPEPTITIDKKERKTKTKNPEEPKKVKEEKKERSKPGQTKITQF